MRHRIMLRSPDAFAPATPAGITLTGNTLAWDASSDPYTQPAGGSGLREYRVYRNALYLATVPTTPGLSLELAGADVGGFVPAGSSAQSGASYTLTAAGNEIYGTSDQFHYVSAPFAADCSITAQLTSFVGSWEFAKCGLMFRDSSAANAAYVILCSFPFAQGQGIKLEYRATTGAVAQDATVAIPMTAARWLKLTRVGSTFSAYYSFTGAEWTLLGTVGVVLGASARAGLAMSSQNPGVSDTVTFNNVAIANVAQSTYTTPDTTAAYTVTAVDGAGNQSAPSASPQGQSSATGDRYGMYWIGGDFTNQYQSAAGIQNMARRQVVVINGWPELAAARGASNASIVNAVKAASTVGTKVFGYYNPEAIEDPPSGVRATQYNQINAANWWAYLNGSAGTKVASYFSGAQTSVNPTTATTQIDGLHAPEWITRHNRGWWINGEEGNAPAPAMDGLFLDNALFWPRVNADWNIDGSTDNWQRSGITAPSPATTAPYRAGWARAAQWFRANDPSRYIVANTSDFWVPREVGGYGYPIDTLQNEFHGGIWEFLLIYNDGAYGASSLAQHYRDLEDSLRDPKWLIVEHHSPTNSANDHQAASYGFAFCRVAGNGYYDYVQQDGHANHEWFDWMAFQLGTPSETRRTAATHGTAWVREFANGIVIWWPRGSTQFVNLGSTYYVLQGDGARWLTPGSAISNVTPPSDRNGLILSRTPT